MDSIVGKRRYRQGTPKGCSGKRYLCNGILTRPQRERRQRPKMFNMAGAAGKAAGNTKSPTGKGQHYGFKCTDVQVSQRNDK